ncbi:hypothetical protein ACSTS3_21485 [Aquimarina muelleri]|uniref:hypothetical protein n=1 Tax=Aquimarina muelleri TaxID=279356 RepID=UPI003F688D6C
MHTRSGIISGVEEGILHIGNTLYLQDKKKAFIQILDENEKLICNQKLDIFIKNNLKLEFQKNMMFYWIFYLKLLDRGFGILLVQKVLSKCLQWVR